MNKRIKKLRETLGLTQREFAKQIDIGASTLAMFETGDRIPKEIHINRICSEFDVNKDWLLTGEGGEKNIFKKIDPAIKAYNHFGYLMENASPIKKAVLTSLIELVDTVDDEKWEYITNTFNEIYNKAKKE